MSNFNCMRSCLFFFSSYWSCCRLSAPLGLQILIRTLWIGKYWLLLSNSCFCLRMQNAWYDSTWGPVSVVFNTWTFNTVFLILYFLKYERNVQIVRSLYIVSSSANNNPGFFSNFNLRAVKSFSEVRPFEYTCSVMLN